MVTVRQIASSLGVSAATVSRSLNGSPQISEEVKARVLREARRVGYGRNRSRTKNPLTHTLGIAFLNEDAWPQYGGYDTLIWTGFCNGAQSRRSGVTLVDLNQRGQSESYRALLTRLGVHGLVLRVDDNSHATANEIAADGVDLVVVADRYDEPEVNYVYCESKDSSREAVEHLIQLGHKRIGFCCNNIMDRDHIDRYEGYREALKRAGLETEPSLQLKGPANVEGGVTAVNRFLSLTDPPTALFFADPDMSIGALRRAQEMSVRVPDELSIVGFDDEMSRRMTYPIYTSVCQNATELGYQAARWLARPLNDNPSQRDALRLALHAFVEVNHSTAPPPPTPVRVSPNGIRVDL